MPDHIIKTFPADYNDEELNSEIKSLSKKIADSGFNINSVMQLSPIITLAQNELQQRVNLNSAEKLNQLTAITEQNAKSSFLSTQSSNRLSKVAIIIAVISLIIQAFFR